MLIILLSISLGSAHSITAPSKVEPNENLEYEFDLDCENYELKYWIEFGDKIVKKPFITKATSLRSFRPYKKGIYLIKGELDCNNRTYVLEKEVEVGEKLYESTTIKGRKFAKNLIICVCIIVTYICIFRPS